MKNMYELHNLYSSTQEPASLISRRPELFCDNRLMENGDVRNALCDHLRTVIEIKDILCNKSIEDILEELTEEGSTSTLLYEFLLEAGVSSVDDLVHVLISFSLLGAQHLDAEDVRSLASDMLNSYMYFSKVFGNIECAGYERVPSYVGESSVDDCYVEYALCSCSFASGLGELSRKYDTLSFDCDRAFVLLLYCFLNSCGHGMFFSCRDLPGLAVNDDGASSRRLDRFKAKFRASREISTAVCSGAWMANILKIVLDNEMGIKTCGMSLHMTEDTYQCKRVIVDEGAAPSCKMLIYPNGEVRIANELFLCRVYYIYVQLASKCCYTADIDVSKILFALSDRYEFKHNQGEFYYVDFEGLRFYKEVSAFGCTRQVGVILYTECSTDYVSTNTTNVTSSVINAWYLVACLLKCITIPLLDRYGGGK